MFHKIRPLQPLLTDLYKNTEVLADKGYFSNKNNKIKLKRYVIEQSFGTLKRIFGFSRAAYFGLKKVLAQSLLKCMCLNLLKASNKVTFDK